jgi:hypothetical protein
MGFNSGFKGLTQNRKMVQKSKSDAQRALSHTRAASISNVT